MGNGALAIGPSYRAHPRLYRCRHAPPFLKIAPGVISIQGRTGLWAVAALAWCAPMRLQASGLLARHSRRLSPINISLVWLAGGRSRVSRTDAAYYATVTGAYPDHDAGNPYPSLECLASPRRRVTTRIALLSHSRHHGNVPNQKGGGNENRILLLPADNFRCTGAGRVTQHKCERSRIYV